MKKYYIYYSYLILFFSLFFSTSALQAQEVQPSSQISPGETPPALSLSVSTETLKKLKIHLGTARKQVQELRTNLTTASQSLTDLQSDYNILLDEYNSILLDQYNTSRKRKKLIALTTISGVLIGLGSSLLVSGLLQDSIAITAAGGVSIGLSIIILPIALVKF